MSKYGFQQGQGMYTGTTFELLTIQTAAATPLSTAVYPTTVMRAFLTVENTGLRFRYDGVSPTVSTGHYLGSGDVFAIIGLKNIQNFKAIAQSGATTNSLIYVTYEVDSR